MINKFYFQIYISDEQINFAKKLVKHSLKHHPVSNIWDKNKKEKTPELRLTGTLGEILFADVYKLKRPSRSFGATDGQDFGQDFQITFNTGTVSFDVKTMRRKSGVFYKNYVLNIPARQLLRKDSKTDFYFCINLHEAKKNKIASFLGYINKKEIFGSKTGILYKAGSKRIRGDNTEFTFDEDTYEVDFKDINTPFVSERIKSLNGFKLKYLK